MHEQLAKPANKKSSPVVLAGNPNVGKSVISGYLSGKYVTVSNYPGTTVEISRGTIGINGTKDTIIDTPGVNNLLPSPRLSALSPERSLLYIKNCLRSS